ERAGVSVDGAMVHRECVVKAQWSGDLRGRGGAGFRIGQCHPPSAHHHPHPENTAGGEFVARKLASVRKGGFMGADLDDRRLAEDIESSLAPRIASESSRDRPESSRA